MISHDDIEAFREADEALSRAHATLMQGTPKFRHIMPEDEISVILAGIFYRSQAKDLALEVLALNVERERIGLDAMSPGEPEYPL